MRKKHEVTIEVPVERLGLVWERSFTIPVAKLNIVFEWYSLKSLNPPDGRKRTKNFKLVLALRRQKKEQKSRKARLEYMQKKVKVNFD